MNHQLIVIVNRKNKMEIYVYIKIHKWAKETLNNDQTSTRKKKKKSWFIFKIL